MSGRCPTCHGPASVVSGACGTWVRCLAGHDVQVSSPAMRLARQRLVSAVRDRDAVERMTPDERVDYRDRMATFRDAARSARAETRAAFGLSP